MATIEEQIETDRKLAEMLTGEEDEDDVFTVNDGDLKIKSLYEALQKLSVKTQPEAEKEINIFVQRRYVLKSKVSVEFVGEPAVDTGGPSRGIFCYCLSASS